ncbi:MAG: type III secretion system gatekeeper subunit SctW [Simkania sp.]|nr:type III secretion system gatekeeper subunit SctW [Simkania sp.]
MSTADNPIYSSRIQTTQSDVIKSQRASQSQLLAQANLVQIASKADSGELAEEMVFNPLAMSRKFQDLKTKTRGAAREEETEKSSTEKKEKHQQVQRISAIADEYARKSNQELQTKTLILVKDRITKNDSTDDVLRKVLETYPDYSVADEVLDFLLETSEPGIANIVKQAKEQFHRSFGREIAAGRNINVKAREFAQQGLGSPTALRDIYRELTGNPRDANTLFDQLSTSFSYEKMKTVIEFMLHALGSDLKSKGPSIPRGELHRLMTETRNLQAILGVYRFFKSRMKLIEGSFKRRGLVLPSRITFEVLARLYMRYLQERYPSPDKVLQLAIQLGIAEELEAQLIIILQLRDASRQIAPRLFRMDQHRTDVLRSFMDALKQIDAEFEEEEEEAEDENDPTKKRKRQKKPPTKLS